MSDYLRQTGGFIMDAVQEAKHRTLGARYEDGHRRGFTAAAGITLRHIQEKLDALKDKWRAQV